MLQDGTELHVTKWIRAPLPFLQPRFGSFCCKNMTVSDYLFKDIKMFSLRAEFPFCFSLGGCLPADLTLLTEPLRDRRIVCVSFVCRSRFY